MAIETITENDDPERDPGRDEATLRARATATIMGLLQERRAMPREIKDLLRTGVHRQELAGRAEHAEEIAADTEEQESNLAVKLDPGDRRKLGFGLGIAIVVALVVLDAVPLNWAAQAFGLNSAGTWLITLILVVASVVAMLGFEVTHGHPRRRRLLIAVVTVAYLALLGLRTEFLITVSSDSLPFAFLQSAVLTAMSAGLVLGGSAILARTRSLHHSRARAAARRAAQAAEEARAAHREAVEKVQRHRGTLHQMLLPWALTAPAPEGVDHAKWTAALEQAIRALFPATT
jgi:uncharacterized membrane protein YgcG